MIGLTALLIRAKWRSFLVIGWLALMLGGLAVSGVLQPRAAADRIAADELASAPLYNRILTIPQAAEEESFTELVERARALRDFTAIYSEQLPVMWNEKDPVLALYRDDFCAHVRMISGRCPSATGEVAFYASAEGGGADPSGPAFARTPPGVGGTVDLGYAVLVMVDGWLNAGLGDQPVSVVGSYRPIDPTEDYWGARRLFSDPVDPMTWPMLTVPDTIHSIPHQRISRGLELTPDSRLILSGDHEALARPLTDAQLGEPSSGLRELMMRIAAKRAYTSLRAPVVVIPVIAAGLWALFIVVGSQLRRDRIEIGVHTVRGLPVARRWWLVVGAPSALVLALVPAGALLAGVIWGDIDGQTVTTAAWTAAAALITVLLAALPLLRAEAADALRRIPARRGGRPYAELALAVLAAVALVQLRSGDRAGLGLYAPVLIACATAALAAWLIPLAARPLTGRAIRRGRVVLGLALAMFTRRSGGRQLVALSAFPLALLALVTSASDVAARSRDDQIRLRTGAERVLVVQGVDILPLYARVRSADPDARYAVAVGRVDSKDTVPMLAVDLARSHLLDWPALAASARTLAVPAGGGVRVSGKTVALELRLAPESNGLLTPVPEYPGLDLAVRVEDERHQISDLQLGPLRWGAARYTGELPARCAAGCRLAAVVIKGAPGESGILTPVRMTSGAGEVTSFDGWHRIGDATTGKWFVGPIWGSDVTVMVPPDAPIRVPVAYTANLAAIATGLGWRLPASQATVGTAGAEEQAAIPRLGPDGVVMDLDTVLRATVGGMRFDRLEVWLTDDAPADLAENLRAAGFKVTEERRSDTVATDDRSPEWLTLRIYRVAVAVGVLLLLITVIFTGASDRRTPDLAALRLAGLSGRAIRRVVRNAYLGALVAGAVLGVGSAALAWMVARDALPLTDQRPWLPPAAWPDPISVAVPLGVTGGVMIVAVYLIFGRRTRV